MMSPDTLTFAALEPMIHRSKKVNAPMGGFPDALRRNSFRISVTTIKTGTYMGARYLVGSSISVSGRTIDRERP